MMLGDRFLGGGMRGMPSNMYNMNRINIRTGHGMLHSSKPSIGGGGGGGGSLDSLEHRARINEEEAIEMAYAKYKEQPGCKIELDDLPAKKWQKDPKKYFNYNFNESKWRMYANKQYKMRKLVENISFRNTDKENFVVRPTLESFRARIAVEYPEECLNDVPDAILEATPLDHRFIDRGFEIPDMYGFTDVVPTLVNADDEVQDDDAASINNNSDGAVDVNDDGGNSSNNSSGGDGVNDSGGSDGVKSRGEKRARTFPEDEKLKNDEELSFLINFLKNHTKPWTINNNFNPAKRQKFNDRSQMMQHQQQQPQQMLI